MGQDWENSSADDDFLVPTIKNRIDPEKWGGANLSFEILGKILVVFLMLQ